jgi:hypothetical protein
MLRSPSPKLFYKIDGEVEDETNRSPLNFTGTHLLFQIIPDFHIKFVDHSEESHFCSCFDLTIDCETRRKKILPRI